MTKNSSRKKAARTAAAANGTNYTTALRAQSTALEEAAHGRMGADRVIPFAVSATGDTFRLGASGVPHLLICGAGSSTMAEGIADAATAHGAEVYLISATLADMTSAVAPHRASEILDFAVKEMRRRHKLVARHGVASFQNLPSEVQPPRLVVIIDEPSDFTDVVLPVTTWVGNRIAMLIATLVREGRSAGVSVVVGTRSFNRSCSLESLLGAHGVSARLDLGLITSDRAALSTLDAPVRSVQVQFNDLNSAV